MKANISVSISLNSKFLDGLAPLSPSVDFFTSGDASQMWPGCCDLWT